MSKRSFVAALLALVLCSLLLLGCGKVLLTDRQQLLLVSDAELQAASDQQYQEIMVQSKLITGTADYVKSQGLGAYASGYKWEFKLIDDDKTKNAFCLPGGKIAVYSGLLPVTKDDAGLAVVISHEIAHALAQHGNERISQSLLVQYGGSKLSEAFANNPEETKKNLMLAFGLGANVGILLPYSRLHEKEADRIGLALMAYAGYDPKEALAFWTRMQALETSAPPEFLSTHPLSSVRIDEIKAELPEAMKYYRAYK
jgi:predicted Zn-dependent protease